MKKRAWPYWLFLLAVLASAMLIFFFSSQSGDASNQSSNFFVNAALSIFHPDYPTLSPDEQSIIYQRVYFLVRKAAHFTEFALLGFALRALLSFHGLKLRTLLAWFAGTLYAGTDEFHQYLVGSRTAMVTDVLIDSAGVIFGCLAALLLLKLLKRHYHKKYSQ